MLNSISTQESEFAKFEKELVVLDFGCAKADWTQKYPLMQNYKQYYTKDIKLVSISSKHKDGFQPLSGIQFHFSDHRSTGWFETEICEDEGANIEEMHNHIDPTRTIGSIAVKLAKNNAICELELADEKDKTIIDIEWENCLEGRDWKVKYVPKGHQLIGLMAHTKNESNLITRLGFVFWKKPESSPEEHSDEHSSVCT